MRRFLRRRGSTTLGQRVAATCDLAACDLAEDACEPRGRIDVVALGRFDQDKGEDHGSAAAFGTREDPVFPADGHWFGGAFFGIVVAFQSAITAWDERLTPTTAGQKPHTRRAGARASMGLAVRGRDC